MDISDSAGEFEVNFDQNMGFTGHMLAVGSTSSGKTYFCAKMIERNLRGPKKFRRRFLIFSSEWNTDKTLKPLKSDRFNKYVDGYDIGEDTYKNTNWQSPEEFFQNEVELRVDNAPEGCVKNTREDSDSTSQVF